MILEIKKKFLYFNFRIKENIDKISFLQAHLKSFQVSFLERIITEFQFILWLQNITLVLIVLQN